MQRTPTLGIGLGLVLASLVALGGAGAMIPAKTRRKP